MNGLAELIYNGTGAVNEYDQYGHLPAASSPCTTASEYLIVAEERLLANFGNEAGASSSEPTPRPSRGSRRRWPKNNGRHRLRRPRRSTTSSPPPSRGEAGDADSLSAVALGSRSVARAKATEARPRRARDGAATRPPQLPAGAMKDRSGIQGIASSPVLVGAVTVLVVICRRLPRLQRQQRPPLRLHLQHQGPGAGRPGPGQRQRGADRRRPGRGSQEGRPRCSSPTATSSPNSASASTRAPIRCRGTRPW